MSSSVLQSEGSEIDRLEESDAVVTENQIRTLSEKNSGSCTSSLPQDFVGHVGLSAGPTIQTLLHTGAGPVIVDERCIIIRPHPECE